MSVSRLSPAEWDAVFVRYLASGQTQRTFCSTNDVPYDAFRVRYRKSERFAGKRRGAPAATNAPRTGTGFVAVRSRPSAVGSVAAAAATAVTIRIEGGVAIECPLLIGIETIASLAREATR